MDSLPPNPGSGPAAAPHPSPASSASAATPSRCLIATGRGRVGKTVVTNAVVQFFRARGASLEAWNADVQNETHSLNVFHPDVLRPSSNNAEDKRLWLEARFDDQARRGFDAVLDMAGGDSLVRELAKGTRLVQTLQRRGVRVVSMQVLGPDVADLDYLKLSMDSGLFMPEATLLVLNAGLIRTGRSVVSGFADVMASEVLHNASGLGAKVVTFPELTCMGAVTDRGLTFAEAARGLDKPGHAPLNFLAQSRAEIFWEDRLPEFFSEIPAEWLPRIPASCGLSHGRRFPKVAA